MTANVKGSACFKCGVLDKRKRLTKNNNESYSLFCDPCQFVGHFSSKNKSVETIFIQLSDKCYVILDFIKQVVAYHFIPNYSDKKTIVMVEMEHYQQVDYPSIYSKYETICLLL